MTNYDMWLENVTKNQSTEAKRIILCRHYAECYECPLFYMVDDDYGCDSTNPRIKAWIENEVDS